MVEPLLLGLNNVSDLYQLWAVNQFFKSLVMSFFPWSDLITSGILKLQYRTYTPNYISC